MSCCEFEFCRAILAQRRMTTPVVIEHFDVVEQLTPRSLFQIRVQTLGAGLKARSHATLVGPPKGGPYEGWLGRLKAVPTKDGRAA